ncbi:hypothetical protein ABK040_003952 [Willaertia magna]
MELSQKDAVMSVLANLSYQAHNSATVPGKNSVERINNVLKSIEVVDSIGSDWEVFKYYDKDKKQMTAVSSQDYVVFKNSKTNEIVISVRGSEEFVRDILANDLSCILFRKYYGRLETVLKMVDQLLKIIKTDFPESINKISAVGHSLGAWIAYCIGIIKGLPHWCFNGFMLSSVNIKDCQKVEFLEKVEKFKNLGRHIAVLGDVVSKWKLLNDVPLEERGNYLLLDLNKNSLLKAFDAHKMDLICKELTKGLFTGQFNQYLNDIGKMNATNIISESDEHLSFQTIIKVGKVLETGEFIWIEEKTIQEKFSLGMNMDCTKQTTLFNVGPIDDRIKELSIDIAKQNNAYIEVKTVDLQQQQQSVNVLLSNELFGNDNHLEMNNNSLNNIYLNENKNASKNASENESRNFIFN